MSIVPISAIDPIDLLTITNNLPTHESDVTDLDAINRSLSVCDEQLDEAGLL